MKLPLFLVGTCIAVATTFAAQPPQLVRLWETEPKLKVPEGVHFDSERQVLYVSNIDGTEPWAKDGAGSIAKVSLDGKILAAEWISGLHAPKGLARHGDRLYVADVQQLVVIDLKAGKIVERLDVPEAQRLNDVSADPRGAVYVTDSQTGRVHRWQDGRLSVFSTAFKGPNGVLATSDAVYVLDQETLHRVDANGRPAVVAKGITGHVDGVEQDGKDFLVTCWEGMTYHVGANGQVTQLLDTRPDKANAADPAFDVKKRILYVPTFWKNTVVAYQVTARE
jgi:sugar lactone lactonase YvrE